MFDVIPIDECSPSHNCSFMYIRKGLMKYNDIVERNSIDHIIKKYDYSEHILICVRALINNRYVEDIRLFEIDSQEQIWVK